MSDFIITAERLSKRYRLGMIGARTLAEGLDRWWRRIRGRRPHPGPCQSIIGAAGVNGAEQRDAEFWALRDASFTVGRGEVVGVIGRNGAGKSTLLKILTRITEPTAGRAVLRGRVASLLEVGTGFHPELTGRENVYLNGAILGMKKKEIDRKIEEIVAFAEVEQFIDTPVKRYSSGMYVRLAFAVAAHLEPEILLVDEVLAVGDMAFQRKCLGKMQDVSQRGRTVLFVSHNMAAIQSLCKRALLLERGRIVFDGPAEEAVRAYIASVQRLSEERPLAERTDREGGGVFRFTHVELRDSTNDVPVNHLISGQPVHLRVHFNIRAPRPLDEVVLSVAVVSSSGAFLCACRSDAVGRAFRFQPGAGVADLVFPRLPLNQGRYLFNLIAYGRGELLDWVREAGAFDVTAGDYYGTGRLPAPGAAGVFVDFDWREGRGT